MTRAWAKLEFFFRQQYWFLVLFVGVVILLSALIGWRDWQPWSTICAGIGGSVLSTVIVSFLGPGGDPVYQAFLKLGVTEFYPDRNKYPKDEWVNGLRQTWGSCTLLGHAHGGWVKDDGFEEALRGCLRRGIKVDIFFLSPIGEAARVREAEDHKGRDDLIAAIKKSVSLTWAIHTTLQPAEQALLNVYVYDATPSLGLTLFDDKMLVTHYLPHQINVTSPLLCVRYGPKPETLFQVYKSSLEAVRKSATLITDENVGNYV